MGANDIRETAREREATLRSRISYDLGCPNGFSGSSRAPLLFRRRVVGCGRMNEALLCGSQSPLSLPGAERHTT